MDGKVVDWVGESKVAKEHGGQIVIIVLTGVNDLNGLGWHGRKERTDLDELRSHANDSQDGHALTPLTCVPVQVSRTLHVSRIEANSAVYDHSRGCPPSFCQSNILCRSQTLDERGSNH